MHTSKGFTIVELLITIAIIAVLTGIVLVNVTAWINQSKDASIQSNLGTVLINSAKFNDNNGMYTGFCADGTYTGPRDAIANIGGLTQDCNETATAFCACSTLRSNTANVFCVDHTGNKKIVNGTDCATECPAAGECL